jgi:hypothetical protein
VIQFPSGPRPLSILPKNLTADLLQAARIRDVANPGADDSISVQSIHAALELDLMSSLSTREPQAAGAADYPLAREVAAASEPAISLHHLELATRQSPVYASIALHDPAFQAMPGPVEEFASRVSFMAGIDQTAGT